MPSKLQPALGSNLFDGYPLCAALQCIADVGFTAVEIASIEGGCMHIGVSEMNPEYAGWVKSVLDRLGLVANAYSGHEDLTTAEGLRNFLKKMEFAKLLGIHIINTNAGPMSRLLEFYKNMNTVISKAEKLELMVCLENHGDIIGTGQEAAAILKRVRHPLIGLNYDTGNVFYHSRGKADPGEDICYTFEYLRHMHLKDIKVEGERITYCALGEGNIRFPWFFKRLADAGIAVPATIETPVFLHSDGWGPLQKGPVPLSRVTIMETIEGSEHFLEAFV
jgi:sugar phosphate isomerase/epimerase